MHDLYLQEVWASKLSLRLTQRVRQDFVPKPDAVRIYGEQQWSSHERMAKTLRPNNKLPMTSSKSAAP
jgi:hypothetical protein